MSAPTYNVDSESDEEEDEEVEIAAILAKKSTWHLHDIVKLKEQTNELLDSEWKETRNKHLLHKMLELEQPSITVKMIDFLLQDGVCEALIGFITQVSPGAVRCKQHEPPSDALKLSYRAVALLSPEKPSEALNALLAKKADILAREIFNIFRPDSAGSFYHAYRIVECLLRCYPSEVHDGILEDGNVVPRMQNMLANIGAVPVGEFLIMLITLSPVARASQLYIYSAKSRWTFFEELCSWNLFYRIAEVIVNPEKHCVCDDITTAEQHSSQAAQLMQELIEKLSLEETGELVLQPLGDTTDLLDLLINCTIDVTAELVYRRSCARLLCFLLRRAAEPEIMCFVNNPESQAPPTPTYVPNWLYPVRDKIVIHISTRIPDICSCLFAGPGEIEFLPETKFSSYSVPKPFTVLRSLIMEILVLMVESDETVAGLITVELWRMFIQWSITYAHNNVYHALFYRLVFAVLRQGQEETQRTLFQKNKFALFLVDNFVPFEFDINTLGEEGSEEASHVGGGVGVAAEMGTRRSSIVVEGQKDLIIRRIAARGLIMNCANAIRLQTNIQPDSTFLNSFLSQHKKWNEFVPYLTSSTEIQITFGMGIKISASEGRGQESQMGMLISEPIPSDEIIIVDHGSRFAKSLGFYEEADWSLALPAAGPPAPIDESTAEGEEIERGPHPSNTVPKSSSSNDDDDHDDPRYRRYSDLTDFDESGDMTISSVLAQGPPPAMVSSGGDDADDNNSSEPASESSTE